MAEQERDRIEHLSRDIYSRQYEDRDVVEAIPGKQYNVNRDWAPQPRKVVGKKKMSTMAKVLIASFVFFLIGLGVAMYAMWFGHSTYSPDKIAVDVTAQGTIASGQDAPMTVTITNNNQVGMEAASLIVTYPDGTFSSSDATSPLDHQTFQIGTVNPGQTANQQIHAVFFGPQNTTKVIQFKLEFRFAKSNAVYDKNTQYTLTLSSSPVDLTVNLPQETTLNQDAQISVDIQSNAQQTLKNLVLVIDYPPGFTFKSASPAATVNSSQWVIGSLSPGDKKTITVTGMLSGEQGTQKNFDVRIGQSKSGDPTTLGTTFNEVQQTTTLKNSFLTLQTLIDGQDSADYSATDGRSIRVDILWKNDLPTEVDNVQLQVGLSGNALDRYQVSAPNDGFYQSSDNSVIWNTRTSKAFAAIQPGQSGQVSFTLSSIPLDVGSGNLVNNPQMVLQVVGNGTAAVGDGTFKQEQTTPLSRTIKINSNIHVVGATYYNTGPFTNTGPIPPKVDTPTTYTVTLDVANTSNDVNNVKVTTTLPAYVNWVGVAPGTKDTVTFNPVGGQVEWDLGTVAAGTGISTPAREISFQVSLTPSISQIGQTVPLTSDITLTGTDSFTTQDLTTSASYITTLLATDQSVNHSSGRVTQ